MAAGTSGWALNLLGVWQLRRSGTAVDVGTRQQRVITFACLFGTRQRGYIASRLWPESTDAMASTNLRSSLHKISRDQPTLLDTSGDNVAIAPDVTVDLNTIHDLVDGVLTVDGGEIPAHATEMLGSADLLPGWYEDWVIFEQERLNQQRVRALEAIARHGLDTGAYEGAVEASARALEIEPLRESAELLLLQAHLAAGNRALAAQVYERFRELLAAELGIAPSPPLVQLIDSAAESPQDSTLPNHRFH